MKTSMVAVLGLSKFGRSLATELANNGVDVLVADKNEELVNQYADIVTYALVADLTDIESIRNLGIGSADMVVVAMSMNLEASIMCVMVAKELGVKKVMVKARDGRMEDIMLRLGADKVIQPEKEYGARIAKTITADNFLEFFDLSDNVAIIEMNPKREWVGHTLKDLKLRNKYGVNVLGFRSKDGIDTWIDPDRPLKESAKMFIVAEKEAFKKLQG